MDIQHSDGLHYLSKIPKNSVDLIITDPPYITSSTTGMGNLYKQIQKNQQEGIHTVKTLEQWEQVKDKYIGKKENLSEETMKSNYLQYGTIYGSKYSVQTDYGDWDTSFTMEQLDVIIGEYYKKLKRGGTLILFFDLWKITPLKELLDKHKFKQIRFIEWIKTNPQPLNSKINYLTNCREIALLGVKGGKPTFHSSYDTAIYEESVVSNYIDTPHSVIETMINSKPMLFYHPIQHGKHRFHPTQKSQLLFEALITKHSREGDVVLDTFLGGGTTAYACQKTHRKCYGCDISKQYIDKVKQRLQDL